MISERWGRFVRWFFIASPTDVGPPKPPLRGRLKQQVARRKPMRFVPNTASPVRVAVKGKP
jgi:hypothetical protein